MEEDDDRDLRTLWAVRLADERIKFWRGLWHMFLMLSALLCGFTLFAGMQYWSCYLRDNSITAMECFRGDRIRGQRK